MRTQESKQSENNLHAQASQSKPAPVRMTPKKYVTMVFTTFLVDVILWVIYKVFYGDTISTLMPIVILIFNLIMGLNIIYYGVKYLLKLIAKVVKVGIKKPLIFFPILIAVIVLILSAVLIVNKTEFARKQYYLDKIQDQMANAAYIKSVGDSIIISKGSVPAGWDVKKMKTADQDAQYNLVDMSYAVRGTKIEAYYFSVMSWLVDIDQGRANVESWNEVASTPPEFEVSLNDKDLDSAIVRSLSKVIDLKEFSDLAVLNNDKEVMRFIEARLLVQLHWLKNLSYAKNPGFFAYSGNSLPFSVYAESSTRVFRDCRGFLRCEKLPRNIKLVQGVWRSTHNYVVGEPSSETLTESWENLEKGMEDTGLSMGGVGLHVGDDGKTKVSPRLQQFIDECHNRGGVVNGSGGVKTNLPTTEDGYTCWTDNNSCWDLLTYSGERYKGGSVHCEKLGLIPDRTIFMVIPAEIDNFRYDLEDSISDFIDIIPDTPSNKWDGKYNIQFSDAACSGLPDAPGFDANTYLSSYFNTYSEIEVRGNKLQGFNSSNIDKDGKTSGSVTVSDFGASGTIRMDLQFKQSKQTNSVNGMFYLSITGSGLNFYCSAKVTGYK
ncbi:MAG: hypothetical protein ABIE03_05510 [Patescibacteria group bacterium]|nr:hypothetical protein [Patescibacteria group bacterium]